MFHGLIHGLDRHEAKPPIKPQGAFVLRGHFQIDAANAGTAEALQGVEEQDRAQAAVAMFGGNAQVLDRAQSADIADALHGAAEFRPPTLSTGSRCGRRSEAKSFRPGSPACGRSPASSGGNRPILPGRGRHWRRSRCESSGTWPRRRRPARPDSTARSGSPRASDRQPDRGRPA